jgi:hypothetical protein
MLTGRKMQQKGESHRVIRKDFSEMQEPDRKPVSKYKNSSNSVMSSSEIKRVRESTSINISSQSGAQKNCLEPITEENQTISRKKRSTEISPPDSFVQTIRKEHDEK